MEMIRSLRNSWTYGAAGIVLLVTAFCGCANEGPVAGTAGAVETSRPALVVAERLWRRGPPGTDAAPAYRFEWRDGRADSPTNNKPARWAFFAEGHVYFEDTEGILWRGNEGLGQAGAQATHSPAGVFYAIQSNTQAGLESELFHETRSGRVSLGTLASVASLRPEGERVFFLGARNGGWVGLWSVDLHRSELRCLSHCDHRVGMGLPAHASPRSTDELVFRGDTVEWPGHPVISLEESAQ